MPERRLRLARQEASDCSWKGMSPCSWLAAVCLPLKVMPSKTTYHVLYPNTNSRLSHGNWYIDNKMKCLSRLKKELPPCFCLWCKDDSSEMCFLGKECDSVQSQADEREGKAAHWGTVCLSPPRLISRVQLWVVLAETSGFFTYFFCNTSAIQRSWGAEKNIKS